MFGAAVLTPLFLIDSFHITHLSPPFHTNYFTHLTQHLTHTHSRRCSEAVSSLAPGPRADSLPWFDSPLAQGASRLRYTDKAQRSDRAILAERRPQQKKSHTHTHFTLFFSLISQKASYTHSCLTTLIFQHWSLTTHLPPYTIHLLHPTPFISHHPSHTLLISHHSSHTKHLTPLISH